MLPIYIPARNEANNLKRVVESIKVSCEYANVQPFIVVVDDGSKDDTVAIASQLGCAVVKREDRGYSALGKPELADTHNSGLAYIRESGIDHNFVMVSGADTIYNVDYIHILLEFLQNNPQVMIVAGVLKGRRPSFGAVTGTGRIYRASFLQEIDYTLPHYYSWESYPLYLTQSMGYQVSSILAAEFTVTNVPHDRTNFKMYGVGMWEGSFIFPYVFMRAMKRVVKFKFKQGFDLIWGRYITARQVNSQKYPKHVLTYIRRYQWQRMIRALTFGRFG